MSPPISESLKKIVDVSEEKPGDLRNKLLKVSKERKTILMACIAPYVGKKVSPTRTLTAELGISEEFAIESVIEQIRETTDISSLYLLLNSPGGFVSSSYKVARALRKNFKKIIVFVPHIAASGGTLVALAGNEIVMGMMSQLSPLDPAAHDGEKATSAKSVVDGFETVTEFFQRTSEEDAPYTYKVLAQKYDAHLLDSAVSALMQMQRYAEEILKGSGYKKKDATEIAKDLVRGFETHGEVINSDKAKKLGLRVVLDSRYSEEWRLFREWLGEHLLHSADKHIIRFVISDDLLKSKDMKEERKKAKLKSRREK